MDKFHRICFNIEKKIEFDIWVFRHPSGETENKVHLNRFFNIHFDYMQKKYGTNVLVSSISCPLKRFNTSFSRITNE